MDKKSRIGFRFDVKVKSALMVLVTVLMSVNLTYNHVRDSGRADFPSSFPSLSSVN